MGKGAANEVEIPTILVVDDIEDNLDLLEFALRRKPIKMLRATSGYECLEMARVHSPDVILLDIQMPGMDGFETLKRLREDRSTAKIPVIFLTAQKKDPTSIEEGLKLGADLYLTKPIDTDELLVRTKMLIRVRKAEEELERTKADFMAMLVHDMRNPILIVKSFLELLLEDESAKAMSQDMRSLAESALESSGKMLELINEILDLSKYESGNVPLRKSRIMLQNVLENVIKQIAVQCRQKEISIIKDFQENVSPIEADESKLEQAFMNVFSNALKFTPCEGVIYVRLFTETITNIFPQPTTVYHVSIADNGIGIPAEELPNIFNRYKQLSTAMMIKQKGTGLGLAISKLIVEAHGGRISLESTVNKGTTVHIYLPIM
ncbi:MAG: hybrid sensor histidine kinase/response regulator [Bacteroidetes bacterium]|nr:hybrid sensor histidine kinase/response regulator [Bacteroidota bacterium]